MSVPDDRELMRMHADVLFTHDGEGRMLRVNEPNGAPAPRVFVGRTARGSVCRVRHDVDDALRRALEAACASEPAGEEFLLPPHGATPYERLLARVAPVQHAWAGPAYHFPRDSPAEPDAVLVTGENADLLRPHLEPWLADVGWGRLMLAWVVGGRAVSVCCTVRESEESCEAGVETVPDFRGRGSATRVVAAWARAARERRRIPLYSTSWQNVASQAVARKLRLSRYGTDLSLG